MSQQLSREIRVFLSSTFRDMDAERNHLIKQVFPKVRAACLARQVGFTEIDLRWGITEEESKNGATVEICLKEIDRCRDFPPFFIGFLGERYGWIPRHDELSSYWDRRLQSDRTVQSMEKTESTLKSDIEYANTIKKAIDRGISVTELEMDLAVLGLGAAEKIANHALFLLRDAKFTDTLYQTETGKQPDHKDPAFYDTGSGKLDLLKQLIRQSGFLGIDNYTSVEQFGEAIEQYLLTQLDKYFPEDKVPSAFEQSNHAHAAFRFHRLTTFLPREDVRQSVIDALKKRTEQPSLGNILIAGPSGQGKSAFMADLARYIETQHPEYKVIDHYIGADQYNSLDSWINRILQILHPVIKDISGEIPESAKDRAEVLNTWLSMAATRQQCRYVLLLDALDQLGDSGKDLSMLKQEIIGANATVITSAADDTLARESAKAFETIHLPALTPDLKAKLIQATLLKYRKELPYELARKLANAPQSGSPLYLTLAIEELRLDARHETLAPILDAILTQPDAQHLFLHRFLLDEDNGRPELPTLAAAFMALLGASRSGLSEHELSDLLALPDDKAKIVKDKNKNKKAQNHPKLPQVYLSKLLNNFSPFLINKGGNRAPMHRIFGETALTFYDTIPVREHLYAYFSPCYGKDGKNFETRGAAEALYQMIELTKKGNPNQKQAVVQLAKDIFYLPVPVKLNNGVEIIHDNIVLEAIDIVASNKKIQKIILANWLPQLSQYEDPSSLNNLGELLITVNISLARPIIEAALAIREKTLGPEHPDTAESLSSLAGLLLCIAPFNSYDDAENLYRRALLIREKALGHENAAVGNNLRDLANLLTRKCNLLRRNGKDIEANSLLRVVESLYSRSLAIAENAPASNAQTIVHLLHKLAWTFDKLGDIETAEPLFRRALSLSEKFYGPENGWSLAIRNNLNKLLKAKGDL